MEELRVLHNDLRRRLLDHVDLVSENRRDPWRRADEPFATHPATYRLIPALEAIEEEMKPSGLPANIYAFV